MKKHSDLAPERRMDSCVILGNSDKEILVAVADAFDPLISSSNGTQALVPVKDGLPANAIAPPAPLSARFPEKTLGAVIIAAAPGQSRRPPPPIYLPAELFQTYKLEVAPRTVIDDPPSWISIPPP